MKKALYIFLVFQFSLFNFQFVSAQCTVKGVLFDEKDGEAVPFANVVLYESDPTAPNGLKQTSHLCATDINGFFLINRVPEGKYTLKVLFVGYEEYSSELDLKKG